MNNDERKIFWDNLCSLDADSSSKDISRFFDSIKYPRFICRYRPITMRSIEALQTNKMFFSSAYYYDDPFDTYLHIDWKRIESIINSIDLQSPKAFEYFQKACEQFNIRPSEEFKCLFESLTHGDLLKVAISTLNEKIRPQMQKYSYSICFSEDPLNETLWLKYASNHTGFCLVYDLADEPKYRCGKEEKCKICANNQRASIYPVYYSSEKYDATNYAFSQSVFSFIANDLNNEELAKRYISDIPMSWEAEKVALIKHKCHEYDSEWRIISHNRFAENTFIKWTPSKIIIGLKTEQTEETLIVRAAMTAGIEHIYKAYISPTDDFDAYELNKEQISQIISR